MAFPILPPGPPIHQLQLIIPPRSFTAWHHPERQQRRDASDCAQEQKCLTLISQCFAEQREAEGEADVAAPHAGVGQRQRGALDVVRETLHSHHPEQRTWPALESADKEHDSDNADVLGDGGKDRSRVVCQSQQQSSDVHNGQRGDQETLPAESVQEGEGHEDAEEVPGADCSECQNESVMREVSLEDGRRVEHDRVDAGQLRHHSQDRPDTNPPQTTTRKQQPPLRAGGWAGGGGGCAILTVTSCMLTVCDQRRR
jgi:hypothetical protein